MKGAAPAICPRLRCRNPFQPALQPWDQRLCLVPDSDLFKSITSGTRLVATGEIATFTADGIRLKSGEEIPADIVVSATGLQMLALGGVRLSVDGAPVDPGHSFVYKGVMLGDVPNFAFCVGYTNASWTLRADLSSLFVTRLLNHMQRHDYHTVVPVAIPPNSSPSPFSTSTPATYSAPSPICPSRPRPNPGSSARTTSSTPSP